jgi:hypothetical protein
MSNPAKIGLVIAGYVLACLAASGAVSVYQWFTQSAAAQASAGMFAFGDLLLFLFLFGIFALLPTGAGLYFLLRSGKK